MRKILRLYVAYSTTAVCAMLLSAYTILAWIRPIITLSWSISFIFLIGYLVRPGVLYIIASNIALGRSPTLKPFSIRHIPFLLTFRWRKHNAASRTSVPAKNQNVEHVVE